MQQSTERVTTPHHDPRNGNTSQVLQSAQLSDTSGLRPASPHSSYQASSPPFSTKRWLPSRSCTSRGAFDVFFLQVQAPKTIERGETNVPWSEWPSRSAWKSARRCHDTAGDQLRTWGAESMVPVASPTTMRPFLQPSQACGVWGRGGVGCCGSCLACKVVFEHIWGT